jgi:ribonuclease H / adenosylcobalamin/alpha-ribazole phosphatase
MTTIVLVRHAATAWSGQRYSGRGDPPLSDAGRRVAEEVAARLATRLPAGIRIVTSPSRRAHDTAALLASRVTPSVLEVDARWQEVDVGDAEGLTFDEVGARYPDLAAQLAGGDVDIDWPGGETAAALHERVLAAWTEILGTERQTVVVSHAGPIRLAIALATGEDPRQVAFPTPAQAIELDVEPRIASAVETRGALRR